MRKRRSSAWATDRSLGKSCYDDLGRLKKAQTVPPGLLTELTELNHATTILHPGIPRNRGLGSGRCRRTPRWSRVRTPNLLLESQQAACPRHLLEQGVHARSQAPWHWT